MHLSPISFFNFDNWLYFLELFIYLFSRSHIDQMRSKIGDLCKDVPNRRQERFLPGLNQSFFFFPRFAGLFGKHEGGMTPRLACQTISPRFKFVRCEINREGQEMTSCFSCEIRCLARESRVFGNMPWISCIPSPSHKGGLAELSPGAQPSCSLFPGIVSRSYPDAVDSFVQQVFDKVLCPCQMICRTSLS